MITIHQIGAESVAAFFKDGLRHYQHEQRPLMRKAALLLRRAIVAKLKSGSPLKVGTGRKRPDIGPLHKRVKFKVFKTTTSVGARIEYNRRGFYGRFHETGVHKMVTVKRDYTAMIHGRFVRFKKGQTFALDIEPSPIFEPVAKAKTAEVVEIMGNSFGVFIDRGTRA